MIAATVPLRVLTLNVQSDAGDPRRTGLLNREAAAARSRSGRVPGGLLREPARFADRRDRARAEHQSDALDYLPPYADRYGGTAVGTRWPHRVVEVADHRDDVHWWTLAVSVALPDLGDLLFIVPTTPWQLDAAAARQGDRLSR